MRIIYLVFILFTLNLYSQSVTGVTGLIDIPSARVLDDNKLVIGGAFIPKPYFQRYSRRINPGLNTYITYGILPFVELMFRYTHELNMSVNDETKYFPDRMFAIKSRLFKETKKIPEISIGLNDISSFISPTCRYCTNYSASYIVLNKLFINAHFNFDTTIGYGYDLFRLENNKYQGIFAGFSLQSNFLKQLVFNLEYNSKIVNSGFKLKLKKMSITVGLFDFKQPTFSFNYFIL